MSLLMDNLLIPHILGINRQQVCIELEHFLGSYFSLGLGFLCGFFGLVEVRQVFSLQVGVRMAGCGRFFSVLLGRLLGRSCPLASSFIKLG